MRKEYVVVICVLFSVVYATDAQNDSLELIIGNKADEALIIDTIAVKEKGDDLLKSNYSKITTFNGEIYYVEIINEDDEIVTFLYPLNHIEHDLQRNTINRIQYIDGREVVFMIDEDELEKNWEDVRHTFEIEDVEGMTVVDEFYSEFESEKLRYDGKVLEKSALIIMKRKAARQNVDIIYIKDKKLNKAYGELPYIELWGVGYSVSK